MFRLSHLWRMIQRRQFITKIRSLGYVYKTTQKRTILYRKAGGTHFLSVPKAENISEIYARSSLKQAGCSDDDIKTFLLGC